MTERSKARRAGGWGTVFCLVGAVVGLSLVMGCMALAGLDGDYVLGGGGQGGQHTGGQGNTTSTGTGGTGTGGTGMGGTGGVTSGGGGSGGTGGWFDPTWPYRKAITIGSAGVAGDLTDFPVLVRVTSDADLAAHAQNAGELVFTASDGVTKLSHEIEWFDPGGTLDAWVRSPSLPSSSETVLYLYYGNPSAADQQQVQQVWDGNFMGVWHLHQPSGARRDSTSQHNDVHEIAGPIGSVPDAIAGGSTTDFESSSNQHLSIADAQQVGLDVGGPLTISAWLRAESQPGGWRNYIAKWASGGDGPDAQDSYYVAETAAGAGHLIKFVMEDNTSGVTILIGTTTLSLNAWYHVAAVYDGSQMRIYLNGIAEPVTAPRPTGARDSATAFDIGGKSSNPAFNHDGPMDEVRVSNVARSEAWIATAYRNQVAPASFVTLGPEQTSN